MTQTLRYDFLNNPSLVPDTESPSTTPDLSITRATSATMVDVDGYIREVQSGEARFTGATWAENFAVNSETIESWIALNLTVSDAADSINGVSLASITDDATSGNHYVTDINHIADKRIVGRGIIFSAYVKGGTGAGRYIAIGLRVALADPSVFDTQTGTWSTESGSFTHAATDLGGGYYRISLYYNGGNTAYNDPSIGLSPDGSTVSYSGSGDTAYIGGLMLEDVSGKSQTTPSTYIATTTAAVSSLTGTSTKGILIEEARTNLALHNTDTSNAAWVASNVTKGSTSVTAPDGASSTTVRLTASAGNGTLLQSVTSASANRAYSVYMKRVTGTGDIDLTVDGGSTWTTKTLTSEWQRFDITQAAVTNPQFGVRIVTSGDAIDFWGSQLETGAFPTSLIYPTTTASVTRNADQVSANVASSVIDDAGTFYVAASHPRTSVPALENLISLDDGSSSDIHQIQVLIGLTSRYRPVSTTGGTVAILDSGVVWDSANTIVRDVFAYSVNDFEHYTDGSRSGTGDQAGAVPVGLSTLNVGQNSSAASTFNGHIAEIRYYDERLINANLENLSNGLFPVPDVTGLTQAAATTLLLANGFAVAIGTPVYSGDVVEGSVVSQDDVAGAYVAAGTTVTITLSLGPKSGGRSKKGRKYSVEIDEEIFLFDTIAEAQEFLLLTRETAEAAAQKELQRAEKTKTPVKVPRVKVKLITGKPSASKALADAEADAERAIQEAYQKAAEARIQKLAQIARDIPGKGIQTRAEMSRKAKAKRQKQIDELEALIALLL